MTSGFCDCYVAKTVITKPPYDSIVADDGTTATLRCSAVTDQLTPLRIQWIPGNNASDNCATWRTVDEHHQQVLVELDYSHACCAVACSVSNGLSKDTNSANVCWAKGKNISSTGYHQGTLHVVAVAYSRLS